MTKMSMTAPPDGYDPAKCWATSKQTEKQCGNRPAVGMHVCRYHGAGSPQSRKKAAARSKLEKAKQAVQTYGLPIDIDPGTALLEEVHRTAGHVAWLADVVGNLEADSLTWGLKSTLRRPLKFAGGSELGDVHESDGGAYMVEETTYEAAINVWMVLYQNERKHLVVVSKAALDAGIDERRVRIAEELGGEIVRLFQRVLSELQLTPDQQALAAIVVPRALASAGEHA